MKTKNKIFGLKMIVLWALSYLAVYKISGYVAEYIINFMGKDAWIITYPIAGMAMGLAIGLLQWLLLFQFGVPFWWVVASVYFRPIDAIFVRLQFYRHCDIPKLCSVLVFF